MLPLQYSRAWQVGGAILLLGVFAGMVSPALGIFPSVSIRSLLQFDKWLHGGIFLVLTVWYTGQYARRAYWKIAFGLLLFGGGIEVVQRFLTYRSGDFLDFLANLVGVALGLAIALAGLGGWSQRIERRFATSSTGS